MAYPPAGRRACRACKAQWSLDNRDKVYAAIARYQARKRSKARVSEVRTRSALHRKAGQAVSS